jgi:hypothetical protein
MTTNPPALCADCQARQAAASDRVRVTTVRPAFPLAKTRRHEIRIAVWTACANCSSGRAS